MFRLSAVIARLFLISVFYFMVPFSTGARSLVADKGAMTLTLMADDGTVERVYPMACGRAYGDKQTPGDNRTPEGSFTVSRIQKSSSWKHDFGDGKGVIKGAYGPWFIRLRTPGHTGIGIHGTHLPASLGTRATEGCIRLSNKDVAELKRLITPGTHVTILPGPADAAANDSIRNAGR